MKLWIIIQLILHLKNKHQQIYVMKKQILFFLAITFSLFTYAQKQYTIQGKVEDNALNNTRVYLYEYSDLLSSVENFTKENFNIIDSTTIKNNQFTFQNQVPKDHPVLCLFYAPAMKFPFQIALEPGTIEVEIHKGGSSVPYFSLLKGTPVNADLDQYLLKTIREITKLTNEMQNNTDAQKFQEVIEILTKVSAELKANASTLVNKYIESKPLGEQLLFTFFPILDEADLETIKPKLSKSTLEKLALKEQEVKDQMKGFNLPF